MSTTPTHVSAAWLAGLTARLIDHLAAGVDYQPRPRPLPARSEQLAADLIDLGVIVHAPVPRAPGVHAAGMMVLHRDGVVSLIPCDDLTERDLIALYQAARSVWMSLGRCEHDPGRDPRSLKPWAETANGDRMLSIDVPRTLPE